MPEVSAEDLRRFRRLEERLAAAEERRRAAASERTEARREVRRLERETSQADERLEALLAENRRLAAELEDLRGDVESALRAAEAARGDLDGLRSERDEARREATEARTAADDAGREVEQLRLQVEGEDGTASPLTADTVGALLDEFVGGLDRKLPGLRLGAGELKLRVGFAATARGAAFVLPSATRPAEDVGALHEIRLQLDPRAASVELGPG